MTLEQIQKGLVAILGDIKPTTKLGGAVEFAYIAGLKDAGVEVPPICFILLTCGRSVTLFKPTKETP
jgi:hypothetical protein